MIKTKVDERSKNGGFFDIDELIANFGSGSPPRNPEPPKSKKPMRRWRYIIVAEQFGRVFIFPFYFKSIEKASEYLCAYTDQRHTPEEHLNDVTISGQIWQRVYANIFYEIQRLEIYNGD